MTDHEGIAASLNPRLADDKAQPIDRPSKITVLFIATLATVSLGSLALVVLL